MSALGDLIKQCLLPLAHGRLRSWLARSQEFSGGEEAGVAAPTRPPPPDQALDPFHTRRRPAPGTAGEVAEVAVLGGGDEADGDGGSRGR